MTPALPAAQMGRQASRYVTRLKQRELVAEATLACIFERPPDFCFAAGQCLDLTVLDLPRRALGGAMRTFSIASAPSEEHLLLLMRMSSTSFKRALAAAPLGTAVQIEGPGGSFTLHADSSRPAVFLAGGVGVAPFRSILRQATHDRLDHSFYLFYSNRNPAQAAYLEELRGREEQDPRFRFVPTMTGAGAAQSGWQDETGHITAALLRRHLSPREQPVYYVAGPSRFVAGMQSVLAALDVGEEDIRVEDYGEY